MAKNKIEKRMVQSVDTTADFGQFVELIRNAKLKAYKSVNTHLIDLYWESGRIVSEKVVLGGWGKSTVKELADHLKTVDFTPEGFSASNIWRMKQFYETYAKNEKLATLLRELPWSHNILIMGQTKSDEAREFYLMLAINNKYSYRELQRQLDSMLFERWAIYNIENKELIDKKPELGALRDNYTLDFLDLPDVHSESQLETAIENNIEKFLLEMGGPFTFVGRQYRLQVGNEDFHIDLLLYHRKLRCFVAIELKIGHLIPRHMSQLDFYLEALDRQVKLPEENPSVGILLCSSKNETVVDFVLSRSMSTAMIAEYNLNLPDKAKLSKRLEEVNEMYAQQGGELAELSKKFEELIGGRVIGGKEIVPELLELAPDIRKTAVEIIKHIQVNGFIDSDIAHEIEGKSLRSAQRLLNTLVDLGVVHKVGSTKSRKYVLPTFLTNCDKHT